MILRWPLRPVGLLFKNRNVVKNLYFVLFSCLIFCLLSKWQQVRKFGFLWHGGDEGEFHILYRLQDPLQARRAQQLYDQSGQNLYWAWNDLWRHFRWCCQCPDRSVGALVRYVCSATIRLTCSLLVCYKDTAFLCLSYPGVQKRWFVYPIALITCRVTEVHMSDDK